MLSLGSLPLLNSREALQHVRKVAMVDISRSSEVDFRSGVPLPLATVLAVNLHEIS